MKKLTTIIFFISLAILVVVCVIGNIITVADKVYQLSPWLGYGFYAILLGLTAMFVVWPIVKILFPPELEPSGELMTNEDKLNADQIVKKSSQNLFLLTMISQNGTLDILTCLSINISMNNRLVELRGKRPFVPGPTLTM